MHVSIWDPARRRSVTLWSPWSTCQGGASLTQDWHCPAMSSLTGWDPDPGGPTMRRAITCVPLLVLAAALLTHGASATGVPHSRRPVARDICRRQGLLVPDRTCRRGQGRVRRPPQRPRLLLHRQLPGLRIMVTNLNDPSKTVMVKATEPSAASIIPTADSKSGAGGHNFLYGFPQVGPTGLATTGPHRPRGRGR